MTRILTVSDTKKSSSLNFPSKKLTQSVEKHKMQYFLRLILALLLVFVRVFFIGTLYSWKKERKRPWMFIFFEKSVVNLNEVCKTGLLYMLYFFRHFSALGKTTQFAVHLEFAFALGRPRERPLSKGISMALELKERELARCEERCNLHDIFVLWPHSSLSLGS